MLNKCYTEGSRGKNIRLCTDIVSFSSHPKFFLLSVGTILGSTKWMSYVGLYKVSCSPVFHWPNVDCNNISIFRRDCNPILTK